MKCGQPIIIVILAADAEDWFVHCLQSSNVENIYFITKSDFYV